MFVAPSLSEGDRTHGSAPHPPIPPVPKGHRLPSPLTRAGMPLTRSGGSGPVQPGLQHSQRSQSSTKWCRVGFLLCATAPDKAEPGLGGCTPEGPLSPLPSSQRKPEFEGVWSDLKRRSWGSLPACCPARMKDGYLHPSPASSCPQGTAGGNFQQRKKRPSTNRTWMAVPPSPSVPPSLPFFACFSLARSCSASPSPPALPRRCR